MLAVALAFMASPAAADSVADFYKGKTVTIIVGYPPASGYTLYAQMLAKYLADHMPGRPNVIVQNMPGAGSHQGRQLRLHGRAQGRHRRSASSASAR